MDSPPRNVLLHAPPTAALAWFHSGHALPPVEDSARLLDQLTTSGRTVVPDLDLVFRSLPSNSTAAHRAAVVPGDQARRLNQVPSAGDPQAGVSWAQNIARLVQPASCCRHCPPGTSPT
ncbi:DUF6415 family natural product biosynthesis protein [Streptomyces sp. NBC_00102]|uniref:DUF6415 family natural product biosynthesis protein n=1 Tax=Streptomyces sp. NBC_00102 TaxID=2975652 RepID=UPI00338EB71E